MAPGISSGLTVAVFAVFSSCGLWQNLGNKSDVTESALEELVPDPSQAINEFLLAEDHLHFVSSIDADGTPSAHSTEAAIVLEKYPRYSDTSEYARDTNAFEFGLFLFIVLAGSRSLHCVRSRRSRSGRSSHVRRPCRTPIRAEKPAANNIGCDLSMCAEEFVSPDHMEWTESFTPLALVPPSSSSTCAVLAAAHAPFPCARSAPESYEDFELRGGVAVATLCSELPAAVGGAKPEKPQVAVDDDEPPSSPRFGADSSDDDTGCTGAVDADFDAMEDVSYGGKRGRIDRHVTGSGVMLWEQMHLRLVVQQWRSRCSAVRAERLVGYLGSALASHLREQTLRSAFGSWASRVRFLRRTLAFGSSGRRNSVPLPRPQQENRAALKPIGSRSVGFGDNATHAAAHAGKLVAFVDSLLLEADSSQRTSACFRAWASHPVALRRSCCSHKLRTCAGPGASVCTDEARVVSESLAMPFAAWCCHGRLIRLARRGALALASSRARTERRDVFAAWVAVVEVREMAAPGVDQRGVSASNWDIEETIGLRQLEQEGQHSSFSSMCGCSSSGGDSSLSSSGSGSSSSSSNSSRSSRSLESAETAIAAGIAISSGMERKKDHSFLRGSFSFWRRLPVLLVAVFHISRYLFPREAIVLGSGSGLSNFHNSTLASATGDQSNASTLALMIEQFALPPEALGTQGASGIDTAAEKSGGAGAVNIMRWWPRDATPFPARSLAMVR